MVLKYIIVFLILIFVYLMLVREERAAAEPRFTSDNRPVETVDSAGQIYHTVVITAAGGQATELRIQ
jgi:hypothetical protein